MHSNLKMNKDLEALGSINQNKQKRATGGLQKWRQNALKAKNLKKVQTPEVGLNKRDLPARLYYQRLNSQKRSELQSRD